VGMEQDGAAINPGIARQASCYSQGKGRLSGSRWAKHTDDLSSEDIEVYCVECTTPPAGRRTV
jgi:hypothetical protein